MSKSFQSLVIEVDVGDFDIICTQRGDVNCKSMILGGDFDATGPQILDRLVRSTMTEFQLVGFSTHGKSKNLDSQADAEYGPESQKRSNRLHSITHGFGVPWAI